MVQIDFFYERCVHFIYPSPRHKNNVKLPVCDIIILPLLYLKQEAFIAKEDMSDMYK